MVLSLPNFTLIIIADTVSNISRLSLYISYAPHTSPDIFFYGAIYINFDVALDTIIDAAP